MSDARRIILDCDPGHDDAVAIMLALGSPAIDVVGLTTVGGNQTLEKVTRNAAGVLTMCGRADIGVRPGAARPLLHATGIGAELHGDSGLDGVVLPAVADGVVRDQHAVPYLIDTVMASAPQTITLVATGPLTNLALAARIEPRIVDRVREVVLMGGGYHTGNRTATAEFNVWVDPEAASIVFDEPWPVTMVGLDLTHQALCTPAVEEQVRVVGTPLAEFMLGLMAFFRASYRDEQGFDDPPVHDPCTIAYLIDPSVVRTRRVPVRVETRGELTTGMTVADFRAPAGPDCHTQVATTLDHARFWQLVTDAIATLG